MGAKATFDPVTKLITLTEAPDGNNRVTVDAKADLYSDAKEDWLNDLNLNKYRFPFTTIGGNDLGGGIFAGAYYFLDNSAGWRIKPYEADHYLTIVGNLYGLDSLLPIVIPTTGDFSVVVQFERSSLTQQLATGSGLSPAQDALLTQIGTDTADIPGSVWDEPISTHLASNTFGRQAWVAGAIIQDTQVTGTPSITQVQLLAGSSEDDHYNDLQIVPKQGAVNGQARIVVDYDGASKTVTVDEPWTQAPGVGDAIMLRAIHNHPKTQIAQAVWDHTQ
jgi:hypothetical protein